MKKVKKSSNNINNKVINNNIFKPEIRASRITIDSKICNQTKFNELFTILEDTQKF